MNALDRFARREVWVSWKNAKRKGKATKVPFAIDGQEASSDDPSTWMTKAQAVKAARERKHQGIGIMFGALGEGQQLGGIDLDACLDDDGTVAPWAREILDLVPGCYTEVSPSGRGLKTYFIHDPRETLPAAEHWRRGVRRRSGGDKDHGIELYLQGRYFAVTGKTFEDRDEIKLVTLDRLQAVQDLMNAFQPRPAPKPIPPSAHPRRYTSDDDRLFDAIDHVANNDLHWEEWNKLGMAIYAATGGSERGRAAFLAFSARSTLDDPGYADSKWNQYRRSPPKRIGAGTIFHEAKLAGWRDPRHARKPNGHDAPPPSSSSEDDPLPSTDAAEPVSDGEPDTMAFELETARLARLGVLAYAQQRGDAAKRFKVPVSLIDKVVTALRTVTDKGDAHDIEPWSDPVDGASLLAEIAAAIKRHVRVPTRAEEAIALWVLFSHCLDAAYFSPRLAITAATHESGKTTLLKVIGTMVRRPRPSSSVTPAAVFRTIELWQPTFLLDEVDTYLPENEQLRGVLNSGHSRDFAFVTRTVGDDHKPADFSTWCPLVVALNGKLPATLASRSIHIELQRLLPGEQVERFKPWKRPYDHLARKAARWAADNIDALRDAEPDMEGMTNRIADNWHPLLAIADRVGGDWPARAREAALTLNNIEGGQSRALMLLADLRKLLGGGAAISSDTLVRRLVEMEDRPWPEFSKGKPITKPKVARLLAPLHVSSRDIRDPDDGRSCMGYTAADLADAFARYLPPLP